MQPIYEFGGAGQVIHVAVANGFPPETYAPLVNPLTGQYRVVSLPPRALWPGRHPSDPTGDWSKMADDLMDGLAENGLRNVIAIGHSFGGIASLLAAVRQPARFRALILLDPTILPQSAMDVIAQMQADGSMGDFPLVQGAMRRKSTWESTEAAYAYFKEKALFATWPDETLQLYADWGTRPTADGSGVELAWSPEWEAHYFRTMFTKTWEELPKLSHAIPLLVIRGGDSDTFRPEAAEVLRDLIHNAAYAEVPGHGHLFPLSAPIETRQIISQWLATLA
jgi:pimeloyl-ACP methyl ester carboxylesterase